MFQWQISRASMSAPIKIQFIFTTNPCIVSFFNWITFDGLEKGIKHHTYCACVYIIGGWYNCLHDIELRNIKARTVCFTILWWHRVSVIKFKQKCVYVKNWSFRWCSVPFATQTLFYPYQMPGQKWGIMTFGIQ